MVSDLSAWLISRLDTIKEQNCILVRDPLRLLAEVDGSLHRFANENAFTLLIASTNLVFRELFEKATVSREAKKLLLIDRAPARRRAHASLTKAPPPFYPDLLSKTATNARVDISLRHFLIEKTGDPNWPQEANNPRFARLITGSIDSVLKAHTSLRVAHPTRFTDRDFKTIVAYSALGVPEAAFKKPEPQSYWRIGLIGYPALDELDSLAPEVAQSIREELRKAPAPFCWFADSPPEQIVRAFYLSTILSQHVEHWKLLLASIDPDLKPFSEMDASLISEAAPVLVSIDPHRAHLDLQEVEASLSKDALKLILLEQVKIIVKGRFAEVIENERYSTLIRSLALLIALDNLFADAPLLGSHDKISQVLFLESDGKKDQFVEQRPSPAWENLKTAYRLVLSIREIRNNLDVAVKNLSVKPLAELTFEWFRSLWNDHRVNRLEYYISALERLVFSADFLPRDATELPPAFLSALERIRERVGWLRDDTLKVLANVNSRYQELIIRKIQVMGGH